MPRANWAAGRGCYQERTALLPGEDSATPVAVSGLSGGVQSVKAGGFHSCARKSDGTVLCWEANEFGQLGDGTAMLPGESSSTPVAVAGLEEVRPLRLAVCTPAR